MKDNLEFIEEIVWYNITEKGHIEGHLKNEPAIYIFIKSDMTRCYVGSSNKLKARLSSHRYRSNDWIKGTRVNSLPKFYNSVFKNGWTNFKLGVIEYINVSKVDSNEARLLIIQREQYYLDKIKPSLNICKRADSPIGVKRDAKFSINLSKTMRGKTLGRSIKIDLNPRNLTIETRLRMSKNTRGVYVKIFDKDKNLIGEFPTISAAAMFLNIGKSTLANVYKTGISYDEYTYEFEAKNNIILILGNKNEFISKIKGLKKASILLNIPMTTMFRYLKSGKIYKNKYYFVYE